MFVHDTDWAPVLSELDQRLPSRFRGHPVRFGFSADPTERLRVEVTSVSAFAQQQFGFDPRGGAAPVVDWLSLTGQSALEVVSGAVFEDQTGELTALRDALAWYPDDIWRYVVACDWQRIDQEMPLIGRAGDRRDELGSRTIAGRLVDIAVHLGFMLSRSWPPYWCVFRLSASVGDRMPKSSRATHVDGLADEGTAGRQASVGSRESASATAAWMSASSHSWSTTLPAR